MTTFRLGKDGLEKASYREALALLRRGGVAVLPTDTLYGLSCLADNEEAIAKIKRMKGREENKPLLVLAGSLAMLKKYAHLSRRQEERLEKIWRSPRPTTLILHHKGKLPRTLTGSLDTLAVRLPKDDFLIKMIKELGTPLVSTSVNRSGKEAISDPGEIKLSFTGKSAPDLVIDAGKCRRKRASRLIDASVEGKIRIIRR